MNYCKIYRLCQTCCLCCNGLRTADCLPNIRIDTLAVVTSWKNVECLLLVAVVALLLLVGKYVATYTGLAGTM